MSRLFNFFSQFRSTEDETDNVSVEGENLSETDDKHHHDGIVDKENDEKTDIIESKSFLRQYKEETVEPLKKYIADRFCTEAQNDNDSYTDATISSEEWDDIEARNDETMDCNNNVFSLSLNNGKSGNNAYSESSPYQDSSPDIMTAFETQDFQRIEHIVNSSPVSVSKKASKKRKRVVCIHEVKNECTDIDSVDQHTKTLSLATCKIIDLWELRSTRRMYPEIRLEENLVRSNMTGSKRNKLSSLLQHRSWEEDGPFQWVYRNVISFELMELEDQSSIDQNSSSNELDDANHLRKLVLDTFGSKDHDIDSKYSGHNGSSVSRKYKRIRVFLYGHYASKFNNLLQSIPKGHKSVVSLHSIPARCIFPYKPNQSKISPPYSSVSQNILRHTFGKLSKQCICVGGKSRMKIEHEMASDHTTHMNQSILKKEKNTESNSLSFDDENFEIRLWSYDAKEINDFQLNETFLTLRGRISKNNKDDESIEKKTLKRASDINGFRRDGKRLKNITNYKKLVVVKEIAMKKSSEVINVHGVVLGFSCVSRTKNGNFMMSITLIDDSLPTKPEIIQLNDKYSNSSNRVTNEIDEKQQKSSIHESYSIPHVTLLIFAEDIKKFPNISRAGDDHLSMYVGTFVRKEP